MSSLVTRPQLRRATPVIVAVLLYLALLGALGTVSPALARQALEASAVAGAVIGLAVVVWHVDAAWTLTVAGLLAIFAGNWEYMSVPGYVSPQRLFLIGAILVVLLRAPKELTRPRLKLGGVHFLLGAALIYVVASSLIAGTLFDRRGFFEFFDNFGLLPFVIFPIAALTFRTERRRNVLLVGFTALGVYLSFVAIFESLEADILLLPPYIGDEGIGIHPDRAQGPFLEAATNGLAMYTCAIAAGVGFVKWESRRAKGIALGVMLLTIVGVLLTLTRQAWAAAILATLVTFLAVPQLRRFAIPTFAVAAVVVAGLLAAAPALQDDVEERQSDDRTVWERKNTNRIAYNMFLARPLFGFGYNTYTSYKGEYFKQADTYPPAGAEPGGITVHNLPLLYLSELGLIGLTLFVAPILAAVAGGVLKRGPPELAPWRVALLAEAVAFAVIATFEFPGTFSTLCLWLFAGVAWSGSYAADEGPS